MIHNQYDSSNSAFYTDSELEQALLEFGPPLDSDPALIAGEHHDNAYDNMPHMNPSTQHHLTISVPDSASAQVQARHSPIATPSIYTDTYTQNDQPYSPHPPYLSPGTPVSPYPPSPSSSLNETFGNMQLNEHAFHADTALLAPQPSGLRRTRSASASSPRPATYISHSEGEIGISVDQEDAPVYNPYPHAPLGRSVTAGSCHRPSASETNVSGFNASSFSSSSSNDYLSPVLNFSRGRSSSVSSQGSTSGRSSRRHSPYPSPGTSPIASPGSSPMLPPASPNGGLYSLNSSFEDCNTGPLMYGLDNSSYHSVNEYSAPMAGPSTVNPVATTVTKRTVTSQATKEASELRRKNPAKFQCQICWETFTRKNNLQGHEASHRGEKLWVCSDPTCQRPFARQSDMRRHEKNVHKMTASGGTSGGVSPAVESGVEFKDEQFDALYDVLSARTE